MKPQQIIDAEFTVVSEIPRRRRRPLLTAYLRVRPWIAWGIVGFSLLNIVLGGLLTATIHHWLFGW